MCVKCFDQVKTYKKGATTIGSTNDSTNGNANGNTNGNANGDTVLGQTAGLNVEGGLSQEQAAALLAQVFGANGKDAELRGVVDRLLGRISDSEKVIGELRNTITDLQSNVRSAVEDMMPPVFRYEKVEPGKGPSVPKTMVTHKQMKKLLRVASLKRANGLRWNTMLVGAPGAGKSHVVEQLAEIMELEFYPQEPVLWKYDLIGSKGVDGKTYKPTPIYKAFKHGGVLLFTEIDNSTAEALTAFNAAFANGHFTFPNGELVHRHEDFVLVVDANTWGTGTDEKRTHVRRQLDAATLDRFITIEWQYDEKLELELSITEGGETELTRSWVKRVHEIREAIDATGVRHHATPRASMAGAALLAEGFPQREVEEMVVWHGLDKVQRRKINAYVDEKKTNKESK